MIKCFIFSGGTVSGHFSKKYFVFWQLGELINEQLIAKLSDKHTIKSRRSSSDTFVDSVWMAVGFKKMKQL